ncbi:MAG: rod shape-determining protein MreC [Candidatus Doudnabacteria bacterium]|nr:rod shape-determining protein MreC [Candidatus Doudnabacteria bacterium]
MRFIYTKTFARLSVVFVLIALLIMADAKGYSDFAKDVFLRAYGPSVQTVVKGTDSVKSFFGVIFAIRDIVKENAELNQRINELSFENSRLSAAKQENLGLRRALALREQREFNLVAAEVETLDPTGFTQTIIIDKGENAGVRPATSVITAPGLLVGLVTKVYPTNAEVTLITDPIIKINAEVADSGARGLVVGEHGLSLGFDLITQNEVIKPQDQVITSGLANEFPRGLLIGEITSIQSSSSELFQKAFVSPAADLRNLRFLFVIQ